MIEADFLVIGSGIAGLIFALDVAESGSVIILSKKGPNEGNTLYAQGGIASVTSENDSFSSHIKDTLVCGADLCHPDVVELVISNAPDAINKLNQLGVVFDKASNSSGNSPTYSLGQEGGHSARRILHAGDSTGAEIQHKLYDRASNHKNIKFLSDYIAIDLIKENKVVKGAYALRTTTGDIDTFSAKITMLATGGAGKVYLYTSNPDVATGDGIAMAYRAGAEIGNMEFIQFHPTCLYHPKAKSFLLTEALRGEGGKLFNLKNERFMPRYHAQEELAPRDIVARAIDAEMKSSGDDFVQLDISHRDPEFIKQRFPNIYARCLEYGYDLTKDKIPVVPAAHYCCGGVKTDQNGKTTLENLYCTGESAFTGLHGANRLASNSLLEAIVFAKLAAVESKKLVTQIPFAQNLREWDSRDTITSKEEVLVTYFWDEVRRLMWNLVGIVRSDKRLQLAKNRIAMIRSEVREYYWKFKVTSDLLELRNIIQIAEIIINSAAYRTESRGLHFNLNHPSTDNENWKIDTICVRDMNKTLQIHKKPVPTASAIVNK